MGYIIFKYDPKRDHETLLNQVSSVQSSKGHDLKVMDRKLYRATEKELSSMTADHLVAKILQIDLKGIPSFELVKSKIDLESDQELISVFAENYIGYVGSKWKKDTLLNNYVVKAKKIGFDQLSVNANSTIKDYEKHYGVLDLSSQERAEYFDLVVSDLSKAQDWVLQKSVQTMSEFSKLEQFVMRNF